MDILSVSTKQYKLVTGTPIYISLGVPISNPYLFLRATKIIVRFACGSGKSIHFDNTSRHGRNCYVGGHHTQPVHYYQNLPSNYVVSGEDGDLAATITLQKNSYFTRGIHTA